MDPLSGSSSTPSFTPRPADQSIARASLEGTGSTLGHNGNRDVLRRGHSDGDVLINVHGTRTGMPTMDEPRDGETWMSFLREVPGGESDLSPTTQSPVTAPVPLAQVGQQDELARRRSTSNLLAGNSMGSRTRHNTIAAQSVPQVPQIAMPNRMSSRSLNLDRSLPPTPSAEGLQNVQAREIVIPSWQPDVEVSECPICGKSFSFWFRKHHCRKCGRVVCSNCSPHRITIPRQYIVHPPVESALTLSGVESSNIEIVDLTGDDNEAPSNSTSPMHQSERLQSQEFRRNCALGGGQEVRLCNPCVPDPNPLPPPHYSSASNAFPAFPIPENVQSFYSRPQVPAQASPTSIRTPHGPSLPGRLASQDFQRHRTTNSDIGPGRTFTEPFPYPNTSQTSSREGSIRGPTGPRLPSQSNVFPPARSSSQNNPAAGRRHTHASRIPGLHQSMPPPRQASTSGSLPSSSTPDRYLDYLLQSRPSQTRHRQHASTSHVPSASGHRSMLDVSTPPPGQSVRRPQLREEDECPICHSALPPKGADGSETAREAHVASCIETHFSSSTPRTSHPPTAAAGAAAIAANTIVTNRASAGTGPRASQPLPGPSSSQVQRRRTTGMVVYHASEKDCVGEDGEGEQECVICFEEFAVGDEMGRLECLCKFHKSCIRQWWDKKGVGACPVHQGGH